MQRPTVLLLFGGESSEHDVSISSARNVYAAIDDNKYEVELGYIDRDGKWWLLERLDGVVVTHGAPQLAPVLGSQSFVTFPSGRVIKPDVILPILHGKNGEDGSVQGLAQLLHIPIVGCDMTASALCMDKVVTKELLRGAGIKVVPYETHTVTAPAPDFNKLSMRLGSPLFVKPARSGSSVGVSKVYSEDELMTALETAHQHDPVALIEAGVTGREIEVAVLGNPPAHQASIAGEIKPEGDFYSYDSKYAATSTSQIIIPAEVDVATMARIRELALKSYELMGCRGLARVDFFLLENGTVYLNEINTLPGFTNISMYAKLWRHDGISYSELVERLLSLSLGSTIETNQEEE
ncbi:MAG TPA: D-alanine--D-alanine ligase family protein [Candidatus Saccharimonadales bacterium]|nr:D-alanine--D-alanine ligase family protein [Candidatus Saccharimonadales bacterium]